MFVKLIYIVFALLILKPAQSAEILSRLEMDNSEVMGVLEPSIEQDSNSEDEELTTITILIPSIVTDSETSAGIIQDNPSESNEASSFTSKSLETSNENSFALLPSLTNDLRVNLARADDPKTTGAGNLQLSIFTSNGNGLQILDNVDRQRRGNNHPQMHLMIDPHEPPQMQLVDNTLRLVAIKSSVDDLAMRLFPNLHMKRRSPQDHH